MELSKFAQFGDALAEQWPIKLANYRAKTLNSKALQSQKSDS